MDSPQSTSDMAAALQFIGGKVLSTLCLHKTHVRVKVADMSFE